MPKLYAYALVKTDIVGEETSEGLETDEGTSLLWKEKQRNQTSRTKCKS